jgi:hypothetical protein
MPKLRTHFEQVPLEVVKKIVEEEIRQEKTTDKAQGSKKKKVGKGSFGASKTNGRGGNHDSSI